MTLLERIYAKAAKHVPPVSSRPFLEEPYALPTEDQKTRRPDDQHTFPSRGLQVQPASLLGTTTSHLCLSLVYTPSLCLVPVLLGYYSQASWVSPTTENLPPHRLLSLASIIVPFESVSSPPAYETPCPCLALYKNINPHYCTTPSTYLRAPTSPSHTTPYASSSSRKGSLIHPHYCCACIVGSVLVCAHNQPNSGGL